METKKTVTKRKAAYEEAKRKRAERNRRLEDLVGLVRRGAVSLYNAVSILGWAMVLLNTLKAMQERNWYAAELKSLTWTSPAYSRVWARAGDYLFGFQLFMIADIVFSVSKVVPAQPRTVIMQVSSRLVVASLLVRFPQTRNSLGLLFIALAWSLAEIVRFSYYFIKTNTPKLMPRPLVWLRYSLFVVLYPLGIFGEILIILSAIPFAKRLQSQRFYLHFLYIVLCVYPFGAVVLFKHMFQQRSKQLGPKHVDAAKKNN